MPSLARCGAKFICFDKIPGVTSYICHSQPSAAVRDQSYRDQLQGRTRRKFEGSNVAQAYCQLTPFRLVALSYDVTLYGHAYQVLARSSPDDKYLLVTRLNGTSLPRDREAWEEQHPQLDWDTDRDHVLPGYWDEVSHHNICSSLIHVAFAASCQA